MKALFDEQLSPAIAALLRARGCDVEVVAERPALSGRSDRMILELAASEGRAAITNNVKDFRPLAAERLARGETHSGLILLPSDRTCTRAAAESLADAIERILDQHPDALQSTERWIAALGDP